MILRRGFSLIEMLVVIAIAGILIVAVTMLTGRFFNISRSQFEQTRTTEDARIQIERLTDVMRNARNLDCDGNGTTDQPQEWWLQEATPTKIVFYSTIDSDEATEKITYAQVGNELIRTVEQNTTATTPCTFAAGTSNVVASSIQNTATEPLLKYVIADPAVPFDIKNVVRVRLQLVIDADSRNPENASTLITEITPRLGTTIAVAPVTGPGGGGGGGPGGGGPGGGGGGGGGGGPLPIGWSSATVFATRHRHPSNLGGLAGADSICRTHAQAGSLPRSAEYVAILSDSATDARDRFSVSGPINLLGPGGFVVANNSTDLWDGSIGAWIYRNEFGMSLYYGTYGDKAWTGTTPQGIKSTDSGTDYCGNWSGGTAGGIDYGITNSIQTNWVSLLTYAKTTPTSVTLDCSLVAHLYCIGPS